MCEVGGRECVMVICGGGEVWLCDVDESGLTITATLQLSTKVSLNYSVTTGSDVSYCHRLLTRQWWHYVDRPCY